MTKVRATFRSLAIRNYRLYLSGQAVSLTGTWMQRLGQEWLVLELTGSGTWLGIVAALQFLPLLVLAPWGGLIADRVDKRRLIIATQVLAGLLALGLGIVTAAGAVEVWMVCALALGLGVVTALDHPARQSFVVEMVGPDDVQNAVTLHSILVNAARAVGPAIAGLLIALVGIAAAFFVNAASYIVVVVALTAMEPSGLQRGMRAVRRAGQLREGFRYVWRTPVLRASLLLLSVAGMFAYEFVVTLPVFARFVLHGDARTLGLLNTAFGVGAVVGGLATARFGTPTLRGLLRSGALFGALLLATSLAPGLDVALVCLAFTGAASIRFIATGNSLLQIHAGDEYRGRVMSLWSVAFFGTTPIGAPIVGWVSEVAGPRAGLALGGIATLAVTAWLSSVARRRSRTVAAVPTP